MSDADLPQMDIVSKERPRIDQDLSGQFRFHRRVEGVSSPDMRLALGRLEQLDCSPLEWPWVSYQQTWLV